MYLNEKILPEIADDSVFAFSGKVFLVEIIKSGLKGALHACGKTLSSSLANQGLDINLGTTEVDEYGRPGKMRCKYDVDWLCEGANCEILQPNTSGWRKGKLRIKVSVEFVEDEIVPVEESNTIEAESRLDMLR